MLKHKRIMHFENFFGDFWLLVATAKVRQMPIHVAIIIITLITVACCVLKVRASQSSTQAKSILQTIDCNQDRTYPTMGSHW